MLRPIKIKPCLNGFIVEVGCQTVVFNTPDQLGAEISRFYKDPNKVEQEFIAKRVNDMMANPAPTPDVNPTLTSAQVNQDEFNRMASRALLEASRTQVSSLTREPQPYAADGAEQECRPPATGPL